MLFVLSTLAGGKLKRTVQDMLVEERLGPVLCDLFDHIQWDCSCDLRHLPVHGPGCECNPESALRIQYLRLVRNLCENTESCHVKRTLFSCKELNQLSAIATQHQEVGVTDFFTNNITEASYCSDNKGLLVSATFPPTHCICDLRLFVVGPAPFELTWSGPLTGKNYRDYPEAL